MQKLISMCGIMSKSKQGRLFQNAFNGEKNRKERKHLIGYKCVILDTERSRFVSCEYSEL